MKFITITLFLLVSFACDNAGKPVPQNTASTTVITSKEKPQTAIAHSLENQTPKNEAPAGERSKWKQVGDAIDTKEYDSAIAAAEISLKKAPDDAALKKQLSEAYFKRGLALTTPARQYPSALGDFRRALKYDPSNEDAKGWIAQIIQIYDGMNKEYPKEGEEPPPLPYKK